MEGEAAAAAYVVQVTAELQGCAQGPWDHQDGLRGLADQPPKRGALIRLQRRLRAQDLSRGASVGGLIDAMLFKAARPAEVRSPHDQAR